MGMSDRRKKQRQAKRTQKEARQKNPGKDSVYARKLREIYPPNSPYQPGGKWA